MATDPNRFSQSTIDTLAKRANLKCSNPYCGAPTSGPHQEEDKSINVGAAAHIRGANPGSARYDPEMKPEERRAIVNGIWLCRTCSTLIDTDARRFTLDVLYGWKREREALVLEEIGYEVGERERRQSITTAFAGQTSAAKQIALDQPPYWEFLLVVELLRSKLGRIEEEFEKLERGLIYHPLRTIRSHQDLLHWLINKINDQPNIWRMITVAINKEMGTALGPLGEPGDAEAILRTSNYIEEGCQALLNWDIDFVFTAWPNGFEDLHDQFSGWTKHFLTEIQRIPKETAKMLEQEKPEGHYSINLTLALPPGAEDLLKKVLERVRDLRGSSS